MAGVREKKRAPRRVTQTLGISYSSRLCGGALADWSKVALALACHPWGMTHLECLAINVDKLSAGYCISRHLPEESSLTLSLIQLGPARDASDLHSTHYLWTQYGHRCAQSDEALP